MAVYRTSAVEAGAGSCLTIDDLEKEHEQARSHLVGSTAAGSVSASCSLVGLGSKQIGIRKIRSTRFVAVPNLRVAVLQPVPLPPNRLWSGSPRAFLPRTKRLPQQQPLVSTLALATRVTAAGEQLGVCFGGKRRTLLNVMGMSWNLTSL